MKFVCEDKKLILSLVNEAVCSGATKKDCAKMIGTTPRCLERWRKKKNKDDLRKGPLTPPSNKLTKEEKAKIIKIATSAEYKDLPPTQIVPRLADRGVYIASESSFYRTLGENKLNAHRGKTKPRSNKKPSELMALKPNQLWSWDITYLPTLIKGQFYYLYLFMDVYSRFIVGAKVFEVESSELSSEFFDNLCKVWNIKKNQLCLHQDNGSPMKGSTFLATLQRLGVTPSFSRPRVSDDNPFSESLFKTMKYTPAKNLKSFSSIEEAQAWVDDFVNWYNTEHRHSQIRFVTPYERHFEKDAEILNQRKKVYEKACAKNPMRWSKGVRNWSKISEVYLNPVKRKESVSSQTCHEVGRAGCEDLRKYQPRRAVA